MDPRIPAILQPLLTQYLALLHEALPDLVVACWLHGSIALAAFDEQRSDIDCLTVLSRPLSPDEIARLTALHQTLQAAYPRWLLEVSYLQRADLGQPEESIAPHPCVHDRVLHPASRFDVSPVTWWILQRHGIAVQGPSPAELLAPVPWPELRDYLHQNMNSYWAGFLRARMKLVYLLSDWGVEWVVLGVLRQFYTLRERDICAKAAAGRYALEHTPARYHRVIREAIGLREHRPATYRSRVWRALETVRLLRYVIRVSNERVRRELAAEE